MAKKKEKKKACDHGQRKTVLAETSWSCGSDSFSWSRERVPRIRSRKRKKGLIDGPILLMSTQSLPLIPIRGEEGRPIKGSEGNSTHLEKMVEVA